MPFETVGEPKRKSALVVEQILLAIQSGEFEHGTRLPSERELSDEMGVSRNSVREALTALKLIGVLETRTGAGSFVTVSRVPSFDTTLILDELLGEEDLVKVWEARREIEISLAKLAVERADAAGLANVRDALRRLEEAISEELAVEEYLLLNSEFHASIAECASNSPLRDAYSILERFTREEMERAPHRDFIRKGMRVSQGDHEQILAALISGDVERAADAVRIHYGGLERFIRSQYVRENTALLSSEEA